MRVENRLAAHTETVESLSSTLGQQKDKHVVLLGQ